MTFSGRAAMLGALALCAALAVACNDDDSAGPGDGPTATQGSSEATATGAATEPPQQTPGSFEAARDALVVRLEDYSATIGSLPDDVLAELLAECAAVATASDDEEGAAEICDEIEQAASVGDPGLIDRVIDELGELEAG